MLTLSFSLRKWRVCRTSGLTVLALFVLLVSDIQVADHARAQTRNLLTNPDFEDDGRFLFQDGIREVMIPNGWFAFWHDAPPQDMPLPSNCPRRSDTGCYWARPEFREVKATEFPNRVHSGARAVKYFTYGRMHEAGLYQIVEGIPLGVRLQFSAWMQAWMCSNGSACMGGRVSDAPARMHLQVGIDPWGGIDPWSSDVVWSPAGEAFDRWQLFQVEAMSEAGIATVFVRSRAEWDWPRLNNDVYVDDARLATLIEPTTVPLSNTLPGARYVPTRAMVGVVTHTVEAGETLGSIALAYGVSIEHLMRLNHLLPGQGIRAGQVLLIDGTEPATPTVEPVVPPTATTTTTVISGNPPGKWPMWGWIGAILVLALVAWVTVRRMQRASRRGDG